MNQTEYGGQLESSRLKNKAQHMFEEDIIEPAQKYLSKARDLGSKAVEKGADIVKENPGYSVLGAAAIGFLAGAYFSRRR